MYLRLLFYLLLTLITVSQSITPRSFLKSDEEIKCGEKVSETLKASLNSSCEVLPKASQPSWRKVIAYSKMNIVKTRRFKPNITCPDTLPVNAVRVKLTAENETIYCKVQDSEQFGQNCGYTVEFYYQDKQIAQSTILPNGHSIWAMRGTKNFDISENFGTYPNFSIKLDRNSKRLRKQFGRRPIKTTLNGIYQCSIWINPTEKRIDSNAIYYHWKACSSAKSSKKLNHSLIGEQFRCELPNYNDTRSCEVAEVKHPWNSNVTKVIYTLKYYQAGNETVYQAECRRQRILPKGDNLN